MGDVFTPTRTLEPPSSQKRTLTSKTTACHVALGQLTCGASTTRSTLVYFSATTTARLSLLLFCTRTSPRFITPNYGDRYGDGHIKPRGTSWLYLITACLPWIAYWLAWCPALVAHIKRIKSSSWLTTLKTLVVRFYQWQQAHPTLSFLLCWGCFAPLFFTLARSIIITYIITALPPLAILTSVGMHHVWKHGSSTTQKYWQQGILALGGLVMFGVCGWYASWLLAPSSHAIASRHTMHPFVNTFTPTTSEQQRHTHTPATFIQKLLWPQHRSLKKLVAALPERSPTGEALASATTYAWQEAHAPFSYYVYTQQTQTEQQRQRPWQQRTPQKARSIEGWLQPTLPTAVKNKGYLLLINTTDTAAVQKLKNALHRLKQQGRTVHVYRLTSHASVFDIVWVSYF
jgi:4-amino-4-deoxy-L-arabinose transferase-like glycosyltransferase